MISGATVREAVRVALSGPVRRRSLRASLIVGTVLTALNQGDLVVRGELPAALWWKVPLTYLVPFLVATYGALGSSPARSGIPGDSE